jgi:membrane protein DedA with SNARE-associated domain
MDLMQFFDMILHVDKTLGTLLAQYGVYVYIVLFAIVFCETGLVVLFFFPGDTLLFIAGAFCATGEMSYPLLTALLVIAAVTGNTLNYYIGGAIGHRVFTHDYRWLNKDALQRTHDFFEKHGGKTIIMARFVPVVRTFAPFVAGVSDDDPHALPDVQRHRRTAVGGQPGHRGLFLRQHSAGARPPDRPSCCSASARPWCRWRSAACTSSDGA